MLSLCPSRCSARPHPAADAPLSPDAEAQASPDTHLMATNMKTMMHGPTNTSTQQQQQQQQQQQPSKNHSEGAIVLGYCAGAFPDQAFQRSGFAVLRHQPYPPSPQPRHHHHHPHHAGCQHHQNHSYAAPFVANGWQMAQVLAAAGQTVILAMPPGAIPNDYAAPFHRRVLVETGAPEAPAPGYTGYTGDQFHAVIRTNAGPTAVRQSIQSLLLADHTNGNNNGTHPGHLQGTNAGLLSWFTNLFAAKPSPSTSYDKKLPKVGTTFLINLRRREDRLEEMRHQLESNKMGFERIEAVDARDPNTTISPYDVALKWDTALNAQFDPNKYPQGPHELTMTPSERGCAMSHVRVWREVVKRGLPSALVLEDDALLVSKFKKKLAKITEELPNGEWDVLHLGFWLPGQHVQPPESSIVRRFPGVKDAPDLFRPSYMWQTHCYLVSYSGAKKLLSWLPVDGPVDNYIAKHVLLGELVEFAARTPLANQSAKMKSDIQHG